MRKLLLLAGLLTAPLFAQVGAVPDFFNPGVGLIPSFKPVIAGNHTATACTVGVTPLLVDGTTYYVCTTTGNPGTFTALGAGSAGTVTVSGGGNLISTKCVTGAGTQVVQTPSAACSIDASGNLLANSFNSLTITSSTGTLTVAAAKTITLSNTITVTATDGSTIALGAGGTVLYNTRTVNTSSPLGGGGALSADLTLTCTTCGVTGSPLSQFAATTSAQLAGVLSDETGTGVVVYSTSPTLVTPVLGTPTSVNLANATNYPKATTVAFGIVECDGTTITCTAGVITAVSGGSGTVTVVGAGSLTSGKCATGGGTTTIQTPSSSCGVDSSGNLTANSVSTGSSPPTAPSGGTGGAMTFGEGTAPGANCVVTAVDCIYALASTHQLMASLNNVAAAPLVQGPGSAPTSGDGACFSGTSNSILADCGFIPVSPSVTTLSSLASIGTITTGTWHGSVLAGQYGGTGVANTGFTITLAGNIVTTGAFNTTFAQGATTTVTLPSTSSTMARTDAGQTFTGTQTFSTPIALTSLASTVVNATSPGVGLCHFAGSTQTCTSSLVVAADITSGTITATQLAAADFTTPGASKTFSLNSGYFECTTTCTITMPVPAAGQQYCVRNANNVATVITFAAIGSSARYEATAKTSYGTAGTGTLVSGGTALDQMCLVGKDSTHFDIWSYAGSWTAN